MRVRLSRRRLLPPLPMAGVQRAAELLPVSPPAVPQLSGQQEQGKTPARGLGAAAPDGHGRVAVQALVSAVPFPKPPAPAGPGLGTGSHVGRSPELCLHFQGRYILTPSPLTCGEEQLLHFLGQLLGIAIRADVPLPLDLLPSFWKTLVGEPLDPDLDLQEADILTYNYVKKFESVSEKHISSRGQQGPGTGPLGPQLPPPWPWPPELPT